MALNKPILTKPAGESRLGSYGGGYWNNDHHGSDGPETCEICGTEHPEEGDGGAYIVSTFLGLRVVEECCGKVLDVIYSESGEEFCQRYLEEFAANPADPRYYIFRKRLSNLVAKAMENLQKAAEDLKAVQISSDLDPSKALEAKGRSGRLLLREGLR